MRTCIQAVLLYLCIFPVQAAMGQDAGRPLDMYLPTRIPLPFPYIDAFILPLSGEFNHKAEACKVYISLSDTERNKIRDSFIVVEINEKGDIISIINKWHVRQPDSTYKTDTAFIKNLYDTHHNLVRQVYHSSNRYYENDTVHFTHFIKDDTLYRYYYDSGYCEKILLEKGKPVKLWRSNKNLPKPDNIPKIALEYPPRIGSEVMKRYYYDRKGRPTFIRVYDSSDGGSFERDRNYYYNWLGQLTMIYESRSKAEWHYHYRHGLLERYTASYDSEIWMDIQFIHKRGRLVKATGTLRDESFILEYHYAGER